MSQLDLIAELRAHRPVAPAELRERVRQLAADAPAPRRRLTWRRALVVGIAAAGLAVLAGVLLPRGDRPSATPKPETGALADIGGRAATDQAFSADGDAVEAQKAMAPTAAKAPGGAAASRALT